MEEDEAQTSGPKLVPDPTLAIHRALLHARGANRREPSVARERVIEKLEEAKMWERFHWEACVAHGGTR